VCLGGGGSLCMVKSLQDRQAEAYSQATAPEEKEGSQLLAWCAPGKTRNGCFTAVLQSSWLGRGGERVRSLGSLLPFVFEAVLGRLRGRFLERGKIMILLASEDWQNAVAGSKRWDV